MAQAPLPESFKVVASAAARGREGDPGGGKGGGGARDGNDLEAEVLPPRFVAEVPALSVSKSEGGTDAGFGLGFGAGFIACNR